MSDHLPSNLQAELKTLRARVAEMEQAAADSKQTQARLAEADKRYNDLFEMAGDSLFIVEASSQRIIEANNNAVRRLGYTPHEIRGMLYSDIEVGSEEEVGESSMWKSGFSLTSVYETTHRRNDGVLVPVEVSSRLVRYQGMAVLLNAARDISVRRHLQAEREQLIAELDAYAHTVAHDLKNPITLLMGYSDILLADLHDKSRLEQAAHLVKAIFSAATKMRDIIDELLLLASIRKLQDLQATPLVMQSIVAEALIRLAGMISESGAVVEQPEQWPEAVGYAPWVEEVWVNYIGNAVKYGGQPPVIRLGADVEGHMVRFWVRDNGAGIAPEDQGRLFQQFTRLDHARAEGYGLGLSIVQSIVAKLGGEVGVASQPGEGSTFYFTLSVAAR